MAQPEYNIIDENILSLETLFLAEELVGKILNRIVNGKIISGRIVETEAFLPENDLANHAYIGKTKRNQSLFLNYGHFYVYKTRQYHCLNLVAEPVNSPGCVLIRAVEPISGIEVFSANRNTNVRKHLTNGPGKVCQTFAIDKQLDGQRININEFCVTICDDEYHPATVRTRRIGITKNAEALLRFIDPKSSCLSRKYV